MKVTESHIGMLGEEDFVRLMAVQTMSPFHEDPEPGRGPLIRVVPRKSGAEIAWDPVAESERIDQTRALLKSLSEIQPHDKETRIVAFPEYSIPKRAHTEIDFQSFANNARSIIIPGSYWDSAQQGRQVCHVYVPGGKKLTIAKTNPVPEEKAWMKPAGDLPGIASLIWTGPGGAKVTVNVFICRDYLARSRDPAVTALDDVEGLNIVLMHSRETRLFEGVAGVDLRGLRGEQKRLALFVNAAKASPVAGAALGSALLGAATELIENDVVCALPSEQEGVLMAKVRLWNIEHTTRRPDKRIDEPIGETLTYTIVPNENDPESVLLRQHDSKSATPGHRAIWRTTFLGTIDYAVTIEFYAVHHLTPVMKLFDDGRIARVYAGVIRGAHDIVVRRYFPRWRRPADDEFPSFTLESDDDTRATLDRLLRNEDAWKLEIAPRDILKYRGQPMQIAGFDAAVRNGARLLGHPEGPEERTKQIELVQNILRLAVECDSKPALDSDLKTFVFDDPEEMIATGTGSDAREIYLFVGVDDSGYFINHPRFDQQYVRTTLMKNALVREIFVIKSKIVPRFDFLLKLKCTSNQADDLISDMMAWADDNSIIIRTRTMEIGRYLLKSSLQSVADCNRGDNVWKFVDRIKAGNDRSDKQLALELNQDSRDFAQLFEIADDWARVSTRAGPLPRLGDKAFAFYVDVLFNFVTVDKEEKVYFQRAVSVWRELYDMVPQAFDELRQALLASGLLGVVEAKNEEAALQAIKQFAFEKKPQAEWDKIKTEIAVQVFGILKTLDTEQASTPPPNGGPKLTQADLKREETSYINHVRPLRNTLFHGENYPKFAALIDLTGEDWKDRLSYLNDILMRIVELMLVLKKAKTPR